MKTSLTDTAINLGLPVFPCGADKRSVIPKVAGGQGLHDATRDPNRIRIMFAHRNTVLVGVPTGEASGFDVLDIDYRHGAAEWETTNARRLPETCIHQTKSGGRHLLFIHAPGVRNSASRIAAGVDVRGQGGYIIFPPSPGYSIISGAPIAHWPDWLLALVLPPPVKPTPPRCASNQAPISEKQLDRLTQSILDRVRHAQDGQKHFVLRNMALLLGGVAGQAGFTDEAAIRWLLDALPGGVRDIRSAEQTAVWGLENGRARPIDIPREREAKTRDPRRKATPKIN